MQGSYRTAVTILCAHVVFWVYGLKSDMVRYITVVKGVVRCEKLTIYEHNVSVLINTKCSSLKVSWHIKYAQRPRGVNSPLETYETNFANIIKMENKCYKKIIANKGHSCMFFILQFPKKTSLSLVLSDIQLLPAVTVCNSNLFRFSQILNLSPELQGLFDAQLKKVKYSTE